MNNTLRSLDASSFAPLKTTITVPSLVRQLYKDGRPFTSLDVTKEARRIGLKFARGVVGTALWRMSLTGELHVTNNVQDERPIARAMNRTTPAYWTGRAHRIFVLNKENK